MDDPSNSYISLVQNIEPTFVPLLIVLFILIFCSAFFSGTETAFTSLNHARLKKLAETKKSAKLALKLSEKYDRVLTTLLIGNNIVNIAAATISTLLFTQLFGSSSGPTVSTIVLTIVVLIFGEITPKSLAKEIPEKMAMITVYPLFVFYNLFYPLSKLFDLLKIVINKIFKIGKKAPSLTEEEFKIIVSDIKDEGVLNQNEHDLIQKSIIFDDTVVKKIMTPIDNVVFARKGESLEAIKAMFEENNYSRVPYFDDDTDECLGFLYQKDFYEMLLEDNCSLESLIKTPLFVRETQRIAVTFKKFQKEKLHIALVQNSSKKIVGIVTMEDILEEIVGNIFDEYDEEEEQIRQLSDGSYEMDGQTPLEDIEEKLDIKFDCEDIDTINGYLIYKLGKIPDENEEFETECGGYIFRILSVGNKMIQKVLVFKNNKTLKV